MKSQVESILTVTIPGLAALASLALVTGPVPLSSQTRPSEELARQQFENGRTNLGRGNYLEALKNFRTVADSYPDSPLAGNARLEISRYYLDVADDPVAALKEASEILKRYPTSDSAPYAYLIQGEVVLARSRRKTDLQEAVATFDRVPKMYPDAEAIPRARYLAAESLRLAHDPVAALKRYRQMVADWPHDAMMPKVHIGAGMALLQSGEPIQAMEELQLARSAGAGREDADAALARLSVLYRLFVRAPDVSAFTLSIGSNGLPVRAAVGDVLSVVVTTRGAGYFASKSAVLPFDVANADRVPAVAKPRSLTTDRAGQLTVIDNGLLKRKNAEPVALSVTQGGSTKLLDETTMAVCLTSGDWIVAGNDDRGIQRFAPNGTHIGVFAAIRPTRLAVNEFDEIAALDRSSKGITILDETGRTVALIPPRGTGYELRNLVDIAFDVFGHLYVLDRAAVFVFSPGGQNRRLIRTFTEPDNSTGAFRRAAAFALDAYGRLYIADDRAGNIRLYQ